MPSIPLLKDQSGEEYSEKKAIKVRNAASFMQDLDDRKQESMRRSLLLFQQQIKQPYNESHDINPESFLIQNTEGAGHKKKSKTQQNFNV